MHLCRVKKAGTFLAMGFVNVAATRTAISSEAVVLLICVPEARLQTYAVWRDQAIQPVPACRFGRIYMMLFAECIIRIFTTLYVHTTGRVNDVLRQTAVWAKLACGRENAPLMGAP